MPDRYQNVHQDLINECLRGSRRAQFRIYKLYYKAMYNTSFRILNDEQEAEDIMQESFLKVFMNLHNYSGETSFGSWVKRIVINKSIDSLRKRKMIFESIDHQKTPVIIDDTEEEAVAESVLPETIFREIEKLPDGYRIILSLHLIEGYSHDEIAEILKITASTSRSQYSRARLKLLHNLKNKYKI